MKKEEHILYARGVYQGDIDLLLESILEAKEKGATNFRIYQSEADRYIKSEGIQFFRKKSEKDLLQENIIILQDKLTQAKSKLSNLTKNYIKDISNGDN